MKTKVTRYFETEDYHPMVMLGLPTWMWSHMIRCLKCGEKDACHMFPRPSFLPYGASWIDTDIWVENHRCMPKCKHGVLVIVKCWKCKWFGWFK